MGIQTEVNAPDMILRWVYTIKVNLVKLGQTLTNFDQNAVYIIKVVQSF